MKKNTNINLDLVTKGLVFIGMSATLMGNQSCQQAATQTRVLARRVQVGQITAPPIALPAQYNGQTFDFQTVANQQMLAVIGTTGAFSTANIDPNMTYTPAGLDAEITNDFNNCTSTTDLPAPTQTVTTSDSLGGLTTEVMSKSNSCVINMPQAVVSGAINSFSLVDSLGLNLQLTGVAVLPSVNFNMSGYKLQMQMTARKPLDIGNNPFLAQTINQSGYTGSFSATVSFDGLSLGPSGYYQTPLSTVTQNALTAAVNDLSGQWTAQDPWYTTVLKACGTYIYVNGSSDLNLKVGDVLAVKNVTYEWQGDVCNSISLGDVADTTPVSYAQIVSTGDNIAAAQIIKGNSDYPQQNDTIYAGARVYMYQPVETVQSLQSAKGASGGVCQLPVGTCGSSSSSGKVAGQ